MTFNDIQASFRVMLLKEENERVLSMKNEIFMLMTMTIRFCKLLIAAP
mgnify:CR=1 FL=1